MPCCGNRHAHHPSPACTHLCQESPKEEGGGPVGGMDAASTAAPRGRADSRNKGWEFADAMYTDPDFKLGCLAFTAFYKGSAPSMKRYCPAP